MSVKFTIFFILAAIHINEENEHSDELHKMHSPKQYTLKDALSSL